MEHLRRRQDGTAGRGWHFPRSTPRTPVWCEPVSASFFRHQFICVSQLSEPTECCSNTTDICFGDDLPSEVPVRSAIQSQPGTGNRVRYGSPCRILWGACQSPPAGG